MAAAAAGGAGGGEEGPGGAPRPPQPSLSLGYDPLAGDGHARGGPERGPADTARLVEAAVGPTLLEMELLRPRAATGVARDAPPGGDGAAPASPSALSPSSSGSSASSMAAVVSEATLERWRDAYGAAAEEAVALGMPRSAIPALPPGADAGALRAALAHLEAMLASFMSAAL